MCRDDNDSHLAPLYELMRDPLTRAVMVADGVSEFALVALVEAVARRRLARGNVVAEAADTSASCERPSEKGLQ